MAVYGIWSQGHRVWLDCKFQLGDGRFTQHRGIAVVALRDMKDSLFGKHRAGAGLQIWADGGFVVRALGDDGLPVEP